MIAGRQFSYKRSLKIIFVVLLILGPVPSSFASSSETVIFGSQSWPGVTVKTEVVSQILQKIGYQTKTIRGSTSALNSRMIKNGQNHLDVTLGTWNPSGKKKINRILTSSNIKKIAVNVSNAKYGLAVPSYVWNKGVHSIDDLYKNKNKFNQKVYGIKSGKNGINIMQDNIIKMENKIKRNHSLFKGWRVTSSSIKSMMAHIYRAIVRHEWVAFTAWSPNWINIEYKIKYLKDTKFNLGNKGKILTMANKKFIDNHPNVARFLRNFTVSAKTESQWIYHLTIKNQSKALVADSWIRNHMNLVKKWLDGVKTANGRHSAISAWK